MDIKDTEVPTVLMYATGACPYCVRARALLEARGIHFREIRVDLEPERRAQMIDRSGRWTVPQIWIGDHHVGGFDDLYALERAGKLDALLTD